MNDRSICPWDSREFSCELQNYPLDFRRITYLYPWGSHVISGELLIYLWGSHVISGELQIISVGSHVISGELQTISVKFSCDFRRIKDYNRGILM